MASTVFDSEIAAYRTFVGAAANSEDERARRRFLCQSSLPFLLVSVLGRESLLKKRIESSGCDFDFILLDCPPSLGLLTVNALAVAGEVIIPMQPHFLALQGVGKLLETVALVSRFCAS